LTIIGKLDIFPLMCAADKIWYTELTLIHKNARSVRKSHAQELIQILKIIGQCDINHILKSHFEKKAEIYFMKENTRFKSNHSL
jgi:hypothetical protein